MDEEDKEKPEESEKEGAKSNDVEGIQQETNRTVDDINLAAKRMEEATEKAKIENNRTENNYAKMKIAGEAEGGIKTPKKTEDEKWAENAKKRYEGSGLDPTPDNTPTTYI